MGVFHWIFGKHPPRPADPERSVGLELLPRWQAELVVQELETLGIRAAISDDQVAFRSNGRVDAGAQLFVMEPDADLARSIIAEMASAEVPEFVLRPTASSDEPFLREMLLEAIFVGPGDSDPDPDVVNRPPLSHYVDGFGEEPGDVGWVAEDLDDTPIGAAWVRRFDNRDPGYGFVAPEIPELAMAVVPEWRGQGVGSALLVATLDQVGALSLSVDPDNPARRLYERFGFVVVEGSSTADGALTMLRRA